MDKRIWTTAFFVLLAALFISVVAISYYKYFMIKDFVVQAETECDPTEEKCFIWICDPAEEECAGDPEEDTWYYKYIMKKAYLLPDCDIFNDEECPSPICNEFENCEEIFCEDGNEEEIACTDPNTFLAEHPDYLEEEEEAEEDEAADDEEASDENDGAEGETQVEQPVTTEEKTSAEEGETSEAEQTGGDDAASTEADEGTEAALPVASPGTTDTQVPQGVEAVPAQ